MNDPVNEKREALKWWKNRGSKAVYLRLKERPKEQFILQNRMLNLNSLPESIVTVIKAKFSN